MDESNIDKVKAGRKVFMDITRQCKLRLEPVKGLRTERTSAGGGDCLPKPNMSSKVQFVCGGMGISMGECSAWERLAWASQLGGESM